MSKRRDAIGAGIGGEAAETPNVFNPIVGIGREGVVC